MITKISNWICSLNIHQLFLYKLNRINKLIQQYIKNKSKKSPWNHRIYNSISGWKIIKLLKAEVIISQFAENKSFSIIIKHKIMLE